MISNLAVAAAPFLNSTYKENKRQIHIFVNQKRQVSLDFECSQYMGPYYNGLKISIFVEKSGDDVEVAQYSC